MSEFKTPEFLENRNTEYWHERMKSILPPDLDVSEGGHAFNMTRPTALVAAELCEFVLPQVIQLIIPEWSSGEFLDGHAKGRGLTRKPAVAASGTITVTGASGSIIPAGSLFSTISINEEPSVDYETMEEAKISTSGSVDIPVQCTQGGTVGNAPANTVVMVAGKLDGITSVTNAEAITGGVEEEGDDELIERVAEYDNSQSDNYVGSTADYIRWAKSVPGVGDATASSPSKGVVAIVIAGEGGTIADTTLCNKVYNYIMKPDAPESRLAPIGVALQVTAASVCQIGVSAIIFVETRDALNTVLEKFVQNATEYLETAKKENLVRYAKMYGALASVDGLVDVGDFAIGEVGSTYGTGNISLAGGKIPILDVANIALTFRETAII